MGAKEEITANFSGRALRGVLSLAEKGENLAVPQRSKTVSSSEPLSQKEASSTFNLIWPIDDHPINLTPNRPSHRASSSFQIPFISCIAFCASAPPMFNLGWKKFLLMYMFNIGCLATTTTTLLAATSHEHMRVEAVTNNMNGVRDSIGVFLQNMQEFTKKDDVQAMIDAVDAIFHPDQHVQAVLLEMRHDSYNEKAPHANSHAKLLNLVDAIADVQHKHSDYKVHQKKWLGDYSQHRFKDGPNSVGQKLRAAGTAVKKVAKTVAKVVVGSVVVLMEAFFQLLKTLAKLIRAFLKSMWVGLGMEISAHPGPVLELCFDISPLLHGSIDVATEAAKDIKETVGSGVDGVKDDIDEIWRYVVVV